MQIKPLKGTLLYAGSQMWIHIYKGHCPSKTDQCAPMSVTISDDAATKANINLRIDTRSRQMIDDAARALGKTRTEYMVETARRQAIDVLLDRRLIELEAANFNSFAATLDTPSAPGPKLQALMSRKPAWEK